MSSALRDKSLTQLRGIAQSFGVADIFSKDKALLIQAIESKQQALAPIPKVEIPKPEYDARLMSKPPAKRSDADELEKLLRPYIERGLKFTTTEEQWFMSYDKKRDQGTLRMPLRAVLRCADEIMR